MLIIEMLIFYSDKMSIQKLKNKYDIFMSKVSRCYLSNMLTANTIEIESSQAVSVPNNLLDS